MKFRLLTGLLLFCATFLSAQTPSGVSYPIAQCNGGTCPSFTAVKSHITCSFIDTLTETFYVAGQFRTLGGQTRIGLGAMNAANGTLLPFAPVVDTFGCIYAMSIKGDTLFVGGRFTNINGTPRVNFAAIRISNGQLLPSFNTGIGGAGDTVFSITVYRNRIYVGGKFSTVFGNARANIARLNYDGTVNAWNPNSGGVVRKTMQWQNRMLAIADVGSLEKRIIRIDTGSVSVTQLMSTTNSSVGMEQSFQDFVTRNDSLYAVGSFYEVDGVNYDAFVVCNITTGVKRSWGITIPQFTLSPKNRVHIEYYRDSLYIGTVDGTVQTTTYHKIYVAHYRGATLRTLKTYSSNQAGLNGDFSEILQIGNTRMMEVERFAQHTAFPFGSKDCEVYSWCLKIPTLCGNWIGNPYSACPSDTIWVSVAHQYYYSAYVWSVGFGSITLVPNGDSCMVITGPGFTGGQVTVRGSTSCGTLNSSIRSTLISGLTPPSVSAGADDSLSCIITQLALHGSCTPAPASWSWSGPNAFSNADSVIVNTPGMFYLTCIGTNGCSSVDSTYVFADTIPPVIIPFGATPVITCTNPTVTLDASATYPNDSLRWIIGASSQANPAITALPGNVLLVITDRRNGCSSTDTLLISQNTTPPVASALYTDSILTCTIDSVLLTGASVNPDVIFSWEDSAGNIFSDPHWAALPGYYFLTGTDTANGCASAPVAVLVYTWYTPPHVSTVIDSFYINCSYDSVLLDGMSLTASATLLWAGPTAFSSPDPASTGLQGIYLLIATDTLNGCTAMDTAYVGYEATLDVTGVNDTIICPGNGAVLNVVPVGGTAPFTFQWNHSAGSTALVTVYPSDTLQYVVNVSDGAGCTGADTVIVNVPDALMDSTLSFQPCDPLQPTGQIQIYPWGGVPPYQFSSDNGLTWQTNGVFGSLTYGSYQFLIQDAIGCTRATTGIIDTNSLSPAPEFLVSTSPESGDTIVIVDVSNPRPDSVTWVFPSGTTIVDTSMFSPAIIPADTGAFSISMHAFYGTCEVILTRMINVQPFDSLNADPWMNNAIDSLVLYPNPNSGTFTVHTELQGRQDFVVLVIDELGNERARQQVYDADVWTGQLSVSNPVSGNYILRVVAEFDSAETVFVISQ